MSLRPDPTDPEDMTPEERLEESASIFARGILRLHGRILPDTTDIENLSKRGSTSPVVRLSCINRSSAPSTSLPGFPVSFVVTRTS